MATAGRTRVAMTESLWSGGAGRRHAVACPPALCVCTPKPHAPYYVCGVSLY